MKQRQRVENGHPSATQGCRADSDRWPAGALPSACGWTFGGRAWALAGMVLALLPGCGKEDVPAPYRPTRAHEIYANSLTRAGLAHTALGSDWIAASRRVLSDSRPIEIPYRESFYVDPARVFAQGLQFQSRPGRRLEIHVDSQGEAAFRVFIDLFRTGGPAAPFEHIATASTLDQLLVFEPRDSEAYVLRIQTELLREGRLEVRIEEGPSLGFPVVGSSTSAIESRFGAPRDAGRRRHHGVDIFAPRNTPVTAASRGRITRVDESRLGGRVIWMRDLERPLHHYYAHLESQAVQAGDEVEAGQVIGAVGNSGNARTTRPHLHFGLYARGVGPLDPWDYLFDDGRQPPAVRVDPSLIGQWARVSGESAEFRADAAPPGASVRLDLETPVAILGASSGSYRVRLPGGETGFVSALALEPALPPLRTETAADGGEPASGVNQMVSLLNRPSSMALEICRVISLTPLDVLGTFRDYRLVTSGQCGPGWAALER